jgi:hypothetical protein
MGDPFWREGFGPLLPETEAIPFNDVDALEGKLAGKHFGAFIVEPIQSEAGIQIPTPEYFQSAQSLCRRYGTRANSFGSFMQARITRHRNLSRCSRLATHVGAASPRDLAANGLALSWKMLTA